MISYFFINFLKNKLVKNISNKGGRNFLGRICIRGLGGGVKKNYRFLDLYRRLNLKGFLYKKIKDPFRNCKIGVFLYSNGLSSFMLLQKDLKLYSFIYSGSFYQFKNEAIKNGFSLPIKYMPLFTTLSNIEKKPFEGGLISRSANTGSLLISKDDFYGFLKLNSGWQIKIPINSMTSMGPITDSYICHMSVKKAGNNRNLGYKPKVRGVAMNPCDHPHGGGNGKKSKPMLPTNAWKSIFKWRHTKNTKKDNLKRRIYKTLKQYKSKK